MYLPWQDDWGLFPQIWRLPFSFFRSLGPHWPSLSPASNKQQNHKEFSLKRTELFCWFPYTLTWNWYTVENSLLQKVYLMSEGQHSAHQQFHHFHLLARKRTSIYISNCNYWPQIFQLILPKDKVLSTNDFYNKTR